MMFGKDRRIPLVFVGRQDGKGKWTGSSAPNACEAPEQLRNMMNRLIIGHCSIDCVIRPLQAQKAILAKVQKPVSRDKSWHFFNRIVELEKGIWAGNPSTTAVRYWQRDKTRNWRVSQQIHVEQRQTIRVRLVDRPRAAHLELSTAQPKTPDWIALDRGPFNCRRNLLDTYPAATRTKEIVSGQLISPVATGR
jgi:hypothetical protein